METNRETKSRESAPLQDTEVKGYDDPKIIFQVMRLINETNSWEELLKALLPHLKKWSKCEAVGIRIKNGPDFPYFETIGFSDDFVKVENHLCSYDEDGKLLLDETGKPQLECMCGNILCGRFDPSKSFFTSDGSFWSNNTTKLLATTTDRDRQARTRNRCNSVGYESVALIPLRTAQETFGLFQFNDHQIGRFTKERVHLLRQIADYVAIFISKKQVEQRLSHLTNVLRGVREINQLIIQEKSPHRLLESACEILAKTREFPSVSMGLTPSSRGSITTYVQAGRNFDFLKKSLDQGNLPPCVDKALTENIIVSCATCKGRSETKEDTKLVSSSELVISLRYKEKTYGFMGICLPSGMIDSKEERELLQEVSNDIAFALHAIKLEEEKNEFVGILSDTRDQLRQAQKLEAIGRLASGVAHDFNNIISAQFGYCELMKKKLAKPAPSEKALAKNLNQIISCSEKAAGLTQQLLAFSRKQPSKLQVINLNEIVKELRKMLLRLVSENIEFSINLADTLWDIKADRGQIEQIIMNLVVNACDAIGKHGKLSISTANVNLDKAYTDRHLNVAPGPYALLKVSDTGCGMDAHTKEKLFEPFFTTKDQNKGTGLGLSIVYGMVKQFGGSIDFESELDEGTTFSLFFPKTENDSKEEIPPTFDIPQGRGESILIVEDEMELRNILSQLLEEWGYRVKVAENGLHALALVRNDTTIDLLVSDVVMPKMDGKELAETLKRKIPNLKIMFISGYSSDSIDATIAQGPREWFLEKPFNSQNFIAKVGEILAE